MSVCIDCIADIQSYIDIYSILWITLRYRINLKYTIDEYDNFLCFWAAESDSDIRFPPSRLDFAAHEVTIFRKQ